MRPPLHVRERGLTFAVYRTAIGNSAWPIGLTMVGIHERSGREKISTSKVRPFWSL